MNDWFFWANNNATSGRHSVEESPIVPTDPLAGLNSLFRLETFGPQLEQTGRLFKDVNCTDPATEVGDDVLGVFDPLTHMTRQANQSNSMKAPKIAKVNGLPVLRFDGVDDWLLADFLGSIGGQVTYHVLVKSNSPTWSGFFSFLESTAGGAGARWCFLDAGTTQWRLYVPGPAAVSKNGVVLSEPYDMAPINDWMILTVRTANASPFTRGIGQLEETHYGSFDLADLIFDDPAMSSEIYAYLEAKRQLLIA